MLSLLKISEKYYIDREISLDKFYFEEQDDIKSKVNMIRWIANYKPQISNTVAVDNELYRYTELQILLVEISDPQYLYDICRPIFKKIKYPCLLLVKYKEKWILGACPFEKGKLDSDNNILRSPRFTHWIHPNLISKKAKDVIDDINSVLGAEGELKQMYDSICKVIGCFPLSCISRAHVGRLVYDMCGVKVIPNLLDDCTLYKKHVVINQVYDKYKKRTSSAPFHYIMDTEDVWYAFQNNERIKRIIANRRYRDMEELICRIDMKYENSDD